MKTIILLFLISATSFSQMKVSTIETPILVGKSGPGMGVRFATLEKYESGLHLLTYRDFEFKEIDVYKSFPLLSTDVNDLYNLIMENLDKMPRKDIRVELPNDVLIINFGDILGTSIVTIFHTANKTGTRGMTNIFNKKDIIKLFGKVEFEKEKKRLKND